MTVKHVHTDINTNLIYFIWKKMENGYSNMMIPTVSSSLKHSVPSSTNFARNTAYFS